MGEERKENKKIPRNRGGLQGFFSSILREGNSRRIRGKRLFVPVSSFRVNDQSALFHFQRNAFSGGGMISVRSGCFRTVSGNDKYFAVFNNDVGGAVSQNIGFGSRRFSGGIGRYRCFN